mmetsp:Transcript_52573/g.119833  ORF Transcript_52573/g.119833 Transcript_52573/m.119833 type:complete len:339 (-) Transcript_52573:292-1308(-)
MSVLTSETTHENDEPYAPSCHLYKLSPSARIENELRELTGTGFSSDTPLDPLRLNTIDSMHYLGNAGTETMLATFLGDSYTPPTEPLLQSEITGGGGGGVGGPAKAWKFVDFGAGFGGCARYVSTRLGPRAHVTCVEITEEIHRTALKLTERCGLTSGLADPAGGGDRVTHVYGDIADETEPRMALPFAGGYDAIYSKLTVLHIPFDERPMVWRRLRENIKPGGILYLEDYFARRPLLAVEDEALGVVVGCPPPLPAQDAYAQQLLEAGFKVESFVDITEAWGAFVKERAALYQAGEARHRRVQGDATYENMQEFYDNVNKLFHAGNLGGAVIVAKAV